MFKETKLLQASRAGDRNAFERIVEKYQSTICAITFSGTGRLDVSEELAQETFVNAWENLHQLRDLKGFRAWLYSIARNTIRNYRRQKRPAFLEARPTEAVAEDAESLPEILMRKEERMMLEQAITRLPEKYREPLVLFCRQQQSIRESAKVLGLNEATVRTRLHRARNLLREEVAQRLEHVLEQTGPRKDFAKAVMVVVGSVPIGLATTAKVASSGVAGQAAVTSGMSTVLSGVGVKVVAVVAAVVVVGALVYTLGNNETPVANPDAVTQARAVSSEALLQESPDTGLAPIDESLPLAGSTQMLSSGESHQDGLYSSPTPMDESEQAAPETIVTGTVLDRNTLRPIAGARVGFEHDATVVTDSQGRFRLSWKESREEAWICVVASGYASQRIALRVTRGDCQDVSLRLQPGLTLAGMVVDPNQEPLGNAKVRVLSNVFAYPPVTTNDRGEFEIDGLNPENADVHAKAEHVDYTAESSTVMQSGRLGEATRTEFILTPRSADVVPSGQMVDTRSESTAQATAQQACSRIETTTTDDKSRIYGHVVDVDTGNPLDCFRIVKGDTTGSGALMTIFGYTFASPTGDFDTGRWHLAPGEPASLTVCAEGYDPLTLEAIPVQTVPEDSDRKVFRLQRNERRSTIYVGRVVDNEGQAIQGAEVGFRVEGHMADRGFSRVTTDETGAYMISSIDPHEQIVFVRAYGYASRYCRMSELLLETPGLFIDIVLDSRASVSGYAWDEFGQAIAKTRIVFSPRVHSEEELESMTLFQMLWPATQTDEQGYYELTDLPIGESHLGVVFTDHRGMVSKSVTLNPGDSLELNFGNQGGFVVSGVVVSGVVADGGSLLERVEVQLKPVDQRLKSYWARTDAFGRFKLLGVSVGQYVFATLIPQEAAGQQGRDPNDQSHILYEVMDIQSDLELTADYQTRSINK